jgi:hypothetical protein
MTPALSASQFPRFLVCVDMHGRLASAYQLARHGLEAEVCGSRLSAWVRAPNRECAKEWVASMLYRAGYEVDPIALTCPVSIENDSSYTPNRTAEPTP